MYRLIALLLLSAICCGCGGLTVVIEPQPSPSPSPEVPIEQPTPEPPQPEPTPAPTPTPEPAPICGLPAMVQTPSTRCEHVDGADGLYQDAVAAALDIVVARNLYSKDGRVTDRVGFLTSVAAELQAMGYCAEASGSLDEVAVKRDTNDFNEQYDLIEGDWDSGKITMFLASTCRPSRI